MMVTLCIRTDKPTSEIYVFRGGICSAEQKWEAHRTLAATVHTRIKAVLEAEKLEYHDIEKIVVYRGPGSFTGLRIGISVANALGYGLSIPVIGAEGDDWLDAVSRSAAQFVPQTPLYGSDPHITQQKK